MSLSVFKLEKQKEPVLFPNVSADAIFDRKDRMRRKKGENGKREPLQCFPNLSRYLIAFSLPTGNDCEWITFPSGASFIIPKAFVVAAAWSPRIIRRVT